MTEKTAKAEADKIIQEFYPNSCFDERTQNGDEAAKENAIIHVKGIIKELKKVYIGLPLIVGIKVAVRVDGQISSWRSILTELERK